MLRRAIILGLALIAAAPAPPPIVAQQPAQRFDFAVEAPIVLVTPGGRQRGFGRGLTDSSELGEQLRLAIAAIPGPGCLVALAQSEGGDGEYAVGLTSLELPAGTTLACLGGRAVIRGEADAGPLLDLAGNNITLRNLDVIVEDDCVAAIGTLSHPTKAERTGIVLDNVRVRFAADEGSAVSFNNATLELTAINCDLASPEAAGGAGFGLHAIVDATSRLRLVNCRMFGDTDAVLVQGHASATVTIEGGEYTSTLDAITSNGPQILVRGARARGDQADLYADGGQIDAWGCDVRVDLVVGANARTYVLDIPVVNDGSFPNVGALAFAQTNAAGVRTVIGAVSRELGEFNGGHQTGASNPALTIAQGWDNAATTFKGILVNINNTASAAASRILEMNVGGADRFVVYRDGGISCASLNGPGYFSSIPVMADYLVSNTNPVFLFRNSGGVLALQGRSTVKFGWTNNGSDAGAASPNTNLARAAEGVVSVEGATNATGGTLRFPATSPAQITANQNNYSPAANSYFQRWSSDAARNVTGLTFSAAQVDGQVHVVVNVGSNNIVLVHQSTDSTAANRFLCSTGANVTLAANEGADLIYDGTAQRWRVFKRQ